MASVARKVIRAFLIGATIGMIAGLGFYFESAAINMMAAPATPFDPIAIMLLTFGFCIVGAVGIELSGDIAADRANGTGQTARP